MSILATALAGAPLLLGNAGTAYEVKPADTLSKIAQAHRVSLQSLIQANQLPNADYLRIGQVLKVPKAAAKSVRPTPLVKYVIQPGDTIIALAKTFKIPVSELLKNNSLDHRGRIYAGKFLLVPQTARKTQLKTQRAEKPTSYQQYIVQSGDSASFIAVKKNVKLSALLKLNNLTNSTIIHPGQRLRLPPSGRAIVANSSNSFAGRIYPTSVLNSAAAHRKTLADRAVPNRETTQRMVEKTARMYGVDPALAMAVAYQESGFNQRQVSVADAIGVMQVIPSSGEWASQLADRRLDLLSTQDNITAGVVILHSLLRSAPSRDEAIAGYYQGLSSVRKNGLFSDTTRYVASVNSLSRRFR